MRDDGNAETTIKSYMSHLKAALNWAHRVGLLHNVPTIDMPRRAKGGKMMKGRPATTEEFERTLDKVPAVLFPASRSKHAPKEPSDKDTIIES